MKAPPGIICLEGADGSGKSTLANYFVKHHGARYLHGRIWSNMTRWHRGMMRRAVRLATAGELVILDRHWVSELVYSPIFRNDPHYSNETAAEFDDAIRGAPGVYVLCVPTDARKHLERFEKLKTERPEKFNSIEKVIQRYQDLLHGNVAHPGGNLIDMFIRFGDFREGRKVHHHDIDNPRCDLKIAAKTILKLLGRQE